MVPTSRNNLSSFTISLSRLSAQLMCSELSNLKLYDKLNLLQKPRRLFLPLHFFTALLPKGPNYEEEEEEVVYGLLQENTTLGSPTKRYITRATCALEKSNSKSSHIRKENIKQKELPETLKKQKRGMRMVLEGRFTFGTEEIPKVVKKADAEVMEKKKEHMTIHLLFYTRN